MVPDKHIFIWKNTKQNTKIRSSKIMAAIIPLQLDYLGHIHAKILWWRRKLKIF